MSNPPIRTDKSFLYCPTHSSEHGELNILCLNPNCPQRGLICYLCVFCEPHINACSSYLTPLRLIQHDKTVPSNPQDELTQKVETHLQGIDNLKQKFIKTIDEYETKIRNTLQGFQTTKKPGDQEEDLLEKFITKNFRNEEEFKSCALDLINSVNRVADNDNVQWVYNPNLSKKHEIESNTISYLAVQKKLVEKMEDSLLLMVSEIVMTMTSEAKNYNLKPQKGKRGEQKNATGLENILEVSTESKQQDASISDMHNELKRSILSPSEGGYQPIESKTENRSFSSNVPSNRQSETKERNYTTEMLRDNEEREAEKVKKAGFYRLEEEQEADETEGREERKQESSQHEENTAGRGNEVEGEDYVQLVEEENPRELKYERTELPNLKQSGRSSEEYVKRSHVKEDVNRSRNGREGDEEEDQGEEEEKESLVHENRSVPSSEQKKKGVMEIVGNKDLAASSSLIRVSSSKSSLLARNPNLKATGGRFENIECENYIYVLKRPEKRFDAVALYSREKGVLLEGFGFYCPKPVEGNEVKIEYRIYEGVHEDAKLILSETLQITEHGEPEGKCEIARIFLKNSVPLQENKYYTLVLKYLDEVKLMYGDGKWLNVGPFVFAGITRKIVKHWLELKYKLAESEMMHSGQFPYLIYSKAEEKKIK